MKIKEVQLRNGSKTWRFDTVLGGKRYRRLGFRTREDAEVAAEEALLKISSIGAVAEMAVASDLLLQGFDVYRSVSSNGPCDLIATSADARTCRIEVKSAVVRGGGTHYNRARFDRSKHDVLALVFLRTGEIEYSQGIAEWFDSQYNAKAG
jgi:hypothetical protein